MTQEEINKYDELTHKHLLGEALTSEEHKLLKELAPRIQEFFQTNQPLPDDVLAAMEAVTQLTKETQ